MPEIANVSTPTLLTPFSIVAEIIWAHDTGHVMMTLPKIPCAKLEPHGYVLENSM